jgi:general transcription factor 3C polypeptide 3 (transcription factor C subunit 4)
MDAAQVEQPTHSPQADRSFFTENARGKPRQQRRSGKLTMAERKELERQRQAEFELAFSKLDLLQPGLEANDPVATQEWLDVASFLVDGFRQTKELFPSDFVCPFSLSIWQNT